MDILQLHHTFQGQRRTYDTQAPGYSQSSGGVFYGQLWDTAPKSPLPAQHRFCSSGQWPNLSLPIVVSWYGRSHCNLSTCSDRHTYARSFDILFFRHFNAPDTGEYFDISLTQKGQLWPSATTITYWVIVLLCAAALATRLDKKDKSYVSIPYLLSSLGRGVIY